ncbi:MAG: hypothetical protein JSU81_01485 [Candidatus Coatesbacteria bacterium]|nr:MAG: hypothetical protein JSU81_01485 [Candidatus Coatesbacteria bacterium]
MINGILLYGGAAVIFLWGAAHVAATRGVVAGFGELSPDNKRIITMEWIAEGLALCFVGVVVSLAKLSLGEAGRVVYQASAAFLLVLAALSSLTGARTSVLPMKLCPYVKTAVAAAFVLGTFL